jgi:hypothetical protein
MAFYVAESRKNDYARHAESESGRNMRAVVLVLLLLLAGCSQGTAMPPPPRPALPEVRYVAPGDPKAVAGLTQEAIEALRKRDLLLRQHIERLEQQIQGQR